MNVGAHHTLLQFHEHYQRMETPSTPNVMAIYLLGKVAKDMVEYGIDTLRSDTNKKAEILYQSIEKSNSLQAFVQNNSWQSKTTIAVEMKELNIIVELEKQGFMVSEGYGNYKGKQLRIGNFPATSMETIESFARVLEQY